MYGRSSRWEQSLPVLSRVSQTGSSSLAQYFPLEFSENCEPTSHSAIGRCGQVERFN